MRLTSKLLKQLKDEEFWNKRCIHSHEQGVECEHAIFYAGRQVNERWALVPVAQRFNRNPSGKIKEQSAFYAMNQAKDWGLWEQVKEKYPRRDWERDYELLFNKYN